MPQILHKKIKLTALYYNLEYCSHSYAFNSVILYIATCTETRTHTQYNKSKLKGNPKSCSVQSNLNISQLIFFPNIGSESWICFWVWLYFFTWGKKRANSNFWFKNTTLYLHLNKLGNYEDRKRSVYNRSCWKLEMLLQPVILLSPPDQLHQFPISYSYWLCTCGTTWRVGK